MNKRLFGRLTGLIMVYLGLTGNVPQVLADQITYSIDIPNTGLSTFTGPYVSLLVDRTSNTTATFTFTSLTSSSGSICSVNTCTYLMGDGGTVGLNVNAVSFSVGPVTEAAPGSFKDTHIGLANVDGFGGFNFIIDNNDGFTSATDSISFTLTDLSGTWATVGDVLAANNKGSFAEAHVFVQSANPLCDGACVTGFAGNEGSTSTDTTPSDVEIIPEPSTFMLLGSGLVFVAGFARRWSGRRRD